MILVTEQMAEPEEGMGEYIRKALKRAKGSVTSIIHEDINMTIDRDGLLYLCGDILLCPSNIQLYNSHASISQRFYNRRRSLFVAAGTNDTVTLAQRTTSQDLTKTSRGTRNEPNRG